MSVPPSDSTPETSDDTRWTEDATFYWDWYKHEENLATSRGNFFLVGQSMLFAAYAALRAASSPRPSNAILSICGLGIFGTVIWLLTSIFHLSATRIPLIDELKPKSRIKKLEQFKSSPVHQILRSFNLMSILLPLGILVTWILLLCV